MIRNNVLSMFGVSLVYLMGIVGTNANAASRPIFEFAVPNAVNGANGCSARVAAGEDGCTRIIERVLGDGGICQDTENVRTVCPGATGNTGCGVNTVATDKVVDSKKVGKTIEFRSTCDNALLETVDVFDGQDGATGETGTSGTSCTLTTERDNNAKKLMVTTKCGDADSVTTYVNDGQDADVDTVATSAVNKITAAGIYQTAGEVSTAIANATNKTTLTNTLKDVFADKDQIPTADQLVSTATVKEALGVSANDTVTTNSDFESYKTTVTSALTGKANVSDIYNKNEIDAQMNTMNGKITAAAAGVSEEHLTELIGQTVGEQYIQKTNLVTELEKPETTAAIDAVVSNNATVKAKLDATDADYVALKTNAVTTSTLTTELGKTANQQAIQGAVDLSPYATKTELNGKLNTSDFAATLSNNAATIKEAVATEGYLKSDALDGYAKTENLPNITGMITESNIAEHIPNTVALKTDLTDLQNKTQVDGAIAAATTSEKLQETLGNTYATATQLSAKADKSQIENMVTTSTLTTELGKTANQQAIQGAVDLTGYATTSQMANVVKTTDTEYGNIKTLATGALQKNKLSEELQNAKVVTLNANNKIDDSQLSSNIVTTGNISSSLPSSVVTTTNGKINVSVLPSNVVTSGANGNIDTVLSNANVVTTTGGKLSDTLIQNSGLATTSQIPDQAAVAAYVENAINSSTCTPSASRAPAACTGLMAKVLEKLQSAGIGTETAN